ncbi:hypothetical protein MVEN_01505200 [Mycena venus]|uniref:Uncharacterized protein n=1 Tax=Mycena venus TaxID=2733690 RepID=A0A8H6XSW4_9AGAR|nr:hypothetical protein MVEN_01505200 [Mycena venus]
MRSSLQKHSSLIHLVASLYPPILMFSKAKPSGVEGNPEHVWYDVIQARLCRALLDLVIIWRQKNRPGIPNFLLSVISSEASPLQTHAQAFSRYVPFWDPCGANPLPSFTGREITESAEVCRLMTPTTFLPDYICCHSTCSSTDLQVDQHTQNVRGGRPGLLSPPLSLGRPDLETSRPRGSPTAHLRLPDAPASILPTLPLARREAYDHTARLLLVLALLAEQRRAAHALWAGGVPVPIAPGRPVIPSDFGLGKLQLEVEAEENLEQVWYDAVQTRLDSALLDLVIIWGDTRWSR